MIIRVLILLLLPFLGFSQTKKELEARRKKITSDIKTTSKMLEKTTKNKEATFEHFVTLQNQIGKRETLIGTLEAEIAEADSATMRSSQVIESLNGDLKLAQEEYGRMVRSGLRRKLTTHPLLFVLSADGLNQAFRRFMFLRKYDRFRRMQAEAIDFTRKMLAKKITNIEENKQEKELLLGQMTGQKTILTTELEDKNALLQTLKKDENRLRHDLKKKETLRIQLDESIESIIQIEIQKRAEETRQRKQEAEERKRQQGDANAQNEQKQPENSEKKKRTVPDDNDETDKLSQNFRNNRGKLPWRVGSGYISKKFGKQPHPTIPNIEITNNGIDIRTDEYAAVYAVFEGKVAGVQFIPGNDYTVIIQHGDYYTVYSHLLEAYVDKGETVNLKKQIGQVSTNKITGASELHFELWREKERQNPANWLK